MKNWIGLLIALSLGFVACLLNWKYLQGKTREVEFISFLAIDEDVRLKAGDKFQEEHFARVDIPRKNVGRLPETAVLFSDRQTVVSMKALHEYRGGEIILRQELKTPPAEFQLESNELAIWIPVNSATFVPELVQPGDQVSFVVPDPANVFNEILQRENSRNPAGPEFTEIPPEDIEKPRIEPGKSELVGPFRVISLGDRLGSHEVNVAVRGSRTRENVMGIAVTRRGDGMDPNAEKLVRWMQQPDFRQAAVVLHPRPKDKKRR